MGNAYHDYQMPVTGDQLKNYHVSHGSVAIERTSLLYTDEWYVVAWQFDCLY